MPFFYPGKNHGRLNRRPFVPECADLRAMVNPLYPNLLQLGEGIPLLPGTRAMCDSAAFQEVAEEDRKTPDFALDRQLAFQQRLRDDGCGPSFFFESMSTYDWLAGVDEAIVDGKRVKRRGTPETAERAVAATIEAANVYHRRRGEVQGSIAYAAQGVSVAQYLECVRALLPLIRPGRDWLALGGFCIIGMQRSLIPQFVETCRRIVPLCRARGVHRVHVLGVTVVDPLQHVVPIFANAGIEFSTDSVSMERNATMGKVWDERHMEAGRGASPFVRQWGKASKQVDYHPADLAMENIRRFTAWLAHQDVRVGAPHRPLRAYQHGLFG